MPLFWHNSPYCTPFSSTVWFIYTCTLYIFHHILKWITASNRFSYATHRRFCVLKEKYKRWLIHGIPAAVEESALGCSPELDCRTFLRTLEASDEDDKLERFFASIPGFCGSKVVVDPLGLSIQPNRERLSVELMGLICRTLSSNVVSDSVKIRRMTVCAEAMEAASLPISRAIFDALHQRDEWQGLLSSVDFGLFLRKANRNDQETAYYSQLLISAIIANAQKHDARWFALVTGHLGIPESVLSCYLYHGDSALLANCIHVLRRIIRNHSHCFIGTESLVATLKSVSKFAVQDTLPELQHEFCALWNEAVSGMCNSEDPLIRHTFLTVLSHVRHLYSSLHHGTGATPRASSASTANHDDILRHRSSYPTCDIPAHYPHPDSAFRIPDVVVGETANASPASSFMFACGDATPTTATATSPGADKPLFFSPNAGYAGAFPADSPSPGNFPATMPMPHFPAIAVLPHLAPHHPPTASVDAANPATHGAVHPPVISYIAFPVPYIPRIGSHAPSLTGDTANPPPFILPGALSSPTLIPAPSHAHSDRFGDISYGLTSMSSATTSAWAPAAPQVTPVLDPNVISSYKTPNTHNDAQDVNLPIRVETSHSPFPSEQPTPEKFSETSRPASRNSCRVSAKFPRDIKKS